MIANDFWACTYCGNTWDGGVTCHSCGAGRPMPELPLINEVRSGLRMFRTPVHTTTDWPMRSIFYNIPIVIED